MSNLVEIRGLNIRFTGERTVHAVNELGLVLGDGRCRDLTAAHRKRFSRRGPGLPSVRFGKPRQPVWADED
jgi:hypothetical protein